MATKIVLGFNIATQGETVVYNPGSLGDPGGVSSSVQTARTGSFSEMFWTPEDSLSAITLALRTNIGLKRARLLPASASLYRARLYTDGGGRGTIVPLGLPGGSALTDIPQMSLLVQSNNNSAGTPRRFFIHAIPDTYVTRGEFTPSNSYNTALNNYLSALASYNYRVGSKVNPTRIFGITSNGLVTLHAPNVFTAGQIVTISRSVDANGIKRGGRYAIAAAGPGSNQFSLTGWQYGSCLGGSVYTKTYGFAAISNCTIRHIATRKIGRSFEQFRGRRSAQRK